jgi:hypothetical protein
MDLKARGCSAVAPADTDTYLRPDNNLGLTEAEVLAYINYLADLARGLNLQIGLVDTVDLIDKSIAERFDFALGKACFEQNVCDSYLPFREGECQQGETGPRPKLLSKAQCDGCVTTSFSLLRWPLGCIAWSLAVLHTLVVVLSRSSFALAYHLLSTTFKTVSRAMLTPKLTTCCLYLNLYHSHPAPHSGQASVAGGVQLLAIQAEGVW